MKNRPCLPSMLFFFLIISSYFSSAKEITMEDIFIDYTFYPNRINEVKPLCDGLHYTQLEGNSIIKYNFKHSESEKILFDLNWFNDSSITYISGYSINKNETKILIETNREGIYRYSYRADYYIFDISDTIFYKLNKRKKIELARFSPDGEKISFLKNNNIFLLDISADSLIQITCDGKLNHVINGKPDWVNEEEFAFNSGYDWSPDSRFIAYYRTDESMVKEYHLQIYDSLYPSIYKYKYPKAGEENSKVTIHVYHVKTGKHIQAKLHDSTDFYIPRIKWTFTTDSLCIIKLNRLQNKMNIYLMNTHNGELFEIYQETNEKYLSEVSDNTIIFTSDHKHFIIQSEKSGFSHLYRYTLSGKFVNQITSGPYEISEVLAYNPRSNYLIYSSKEDGLLQNHIYKIDTDGTGKLKISKKSGSYSGQFWPETRYYILDYSNANQAPVYTLYDSTHQAVKLLEENQDFVQRLKDYGFTRKEFIKIPVDSVYLNAYLIKPVNFKKSKTYPLLLYTYGGPGYQYVEDKWDYFFPWFQLLANKGFIVACVDNRGTGGRGEAFKKCTYLSLGKLETNDLINAVKYLGNYPFVNGDRIGIFGWSYGGFLSLNCLMQGPEVFKTGIAVAPITHWKFYDSIYTERYMQTPKANREGYESTSPISNTEGLKGKLLLIHGTADDNVHVQNSYALAKKLVEEGKTFDMIIYPDKNHSIYGGKTRYQLFKTITDYIVNNL